jgi:pimeloyl-ACP methyl ester carboxylesterase
VGQKYLAVESAPAAVLIASAPPRGLAPAMARVARRNARYSGRPSALRRPLVFFAEPAVSRSTFYCRHTPDEIVAQTTAALCDESTRVLYRDLVYRDLARPAQVRVPMLVLGAHLDGFFTPEEIRATARAYRAEVESFPGMGHNMMLEPGWHRVAERIDAWLSGIGL